MTELMCGINGIAFSNWSGHYVDPAPLKLMRDVITLRGPDERGIYIDGGIGLGHRRLSIVEVAAGHHLMTTAGGSLHERTHEAMLASARS